MEEDGPITTSGARRCRPNASANDTAVPGGEAQDFQDGLAQEVHLRDTRA